jgi:glycosyltransferase involved in cell wall biosynthesis
MKILTLSANDPRKSTKCGGVRTYNLNLMKIIKMLGYDLDFYETGLVKNLVNFNKKIYGDYDVILINSSVYDKGFIKLIYQLFRIKNKKVIVQCHGGGFDSLKLKFIYRKLFKKLLNKQVDLFLVLNEVQKDSLKKYFVIPENKILQIPNYTENNFKIEVKNYSGKIKFFYIGRIIKEKGMFDFAEAFMEVESDDIQFNVVGSGPGKDRMLELTKIDSRIFYHGRKFGKEKHYLFKENHIFVFLTMWPEGFPISVLEALNYGMCILSTKFPNSEELVKDDYNGFVIELKKEKIKEKIMYILKNQDKIKQYGINSKKILENNFALEKQGVKIFKNIFNNL